MTIDIARRRLVGGAMAMALSAATVFVLGAVVAGLSPERRGVAFGRGAPYP